MVSVCVSRVRLHIGVVSVLQLWHCMVGDVDGGKRDVTSIMRFPKKVWNQIRSDQILYLGEEGVGFSGERELGEDEEEEGGITERDGVVG